MSYEVTLRGKPDAYTISDEQGEQLKQSLKQGGKEGFIEFGALFLRLAEIKAIEHIQDAFMDKYRLLEDNKYNPQERSIGEVKSMREIIYKHTKDLKRKGVLPEDRVFDVEKEFDQQMDSQK